MDIKELAKWIESNYTEEEINTYIKIKEAEISKLKEEHRGAAAILEEAGRLEKEGETLQAIALYESLLEKNFDGSHPYDRLAVIYKKLKRPDDVIGVLEKIVKIEEARYQRKVEEIPEWVDKYPGYRVKLDKYKTKLEKAKSEKEKQS